jgi:GNAT superfamily N-acetyltransferase/uncharacterized membrane protein (DUF485 family)
MPTLERKPMSDYYRRRRVVIKDTTALLTFFLGFVWSGAFLWPFLGVQVNQGDMTRGLAYFLGAVLATAIVAGMAGLEAGDVAGRLWERYHRQHRAAVGGVASSGGSLSLAWPGGEARHAPIAMLTPAAHVAGPDVRNVYYSESGVYAASFLPLAERVRPDKLDARRVRAALARTTNIGAWDGGRLVGAVRLLSDGYAYTAIADIIVDPEYQRLGIGRELMQRALAVTPSARLLVDAQPECVTFFERIGCVRGTTGLLLTPAVLQ